MNSVAVFLGGSGAAKPIYVSAAQEFGRLVASRGIVLITGGGRIGLMGVLADATLAAGGRVVGVIPRHLVEHEVGHTGLSELHVVGTLAERKARIAALADACVALPGGFGTLDELFEMLTWTQVGLQEMPCGVLNVGGFYDALLAWVDHAVAEGLVRPAHRELLLVDANPTALLDGLAKWTLPALPTLA